MSIKIGKLDKFTLEKILDVVIDIYEELNLTADNDIVKIGIRVLPAAPHFPSLLPTTSRQDLIEYASYRHKTLHLLKQNGIIMDCQHVELEHSDDLHSITLKKTDFMPFFKKTKKQYEEISEVKIEDKERKRDAGIIKKLSKSNLKLETLRKIMIDIRGILGSDESKRMRIFLSPRRIHPTNRADLILYLNFLEGEGAIEFTEGEPDRYLENIGYAGYAHVGIPMIVDREKFYEIFNKVEEESDAVYKAEVSKPVEEEQSPYFDKESGYFSFRGRIVKLKKNSLQFKFVEFLYDNPKKLFGYGEIGFKIGILKRMAEKEPHFAKYSEKLKELDMEGEAKLLKRLDDTDSSVLTPLKKRINNIASEIKRKLGLPEKDESLFLCNNGYMMRKDRKNNNGK